MQPLRQPPRIVQIVRMFAFRLAQQRAHGRRRLLVDDQLSALDISGQPSSDAFNHFNPISVRCLRGRSLSLPLPALLWFKLGEPNTERGSWLRRAVLKSPSTEP